MIESPLLLAALIAAATWLAFWLDRNVAALSKAGASLIALVLGALLSNLNVVPVSSPVYDQIVGAVTSLAIAWLLLAVNLGDLRRAGAPMLWAFVIAVLGTATGALAGAFLFAGRFAEDTWRLAGTLTGTYTGGSVNFVSVGRGVGLPDDLFAGANAADALTTGLWLGITLMLPPLIGRFYREPRAPEEPGESAQSAQQVGGGPRPKDESSAPAGSSARGVQNATSSVRETKARGGPPDGTHEEHHPFFKKMPLSTLDLAWLFGLGLALVALAEWLGGIVPAVPSVLWLTTAALAVGHLLRPAASDGAFQLGNLALHFFFVVIGIFSRISEILTVGVEVFYFTALVVAVHGTLVFGAGKLARLDIGSLAVASQAAVGGPSSALAVAVSKEWRFLILPGVIVGLLGYAVGNYLGFAVAWVVRSAGLGL